MSCTTKILKSMLIAFMLLTFAGCATVSVERPDPYEKLNRGIYAINEVLDIVVLKPVAKGYDALLPQPAKNGVTNFFSNLDEILVFINDFLQSDVRGMGKASSRFIINSTLGIGGLFDVAKNMGIPKHNNDFGLTLADWGYKNSAYFVMPLFGPSTLRDTVGFGADIVLSIWPYVGPRSFRWGLFGLQIVSDRYGILDEEEVLHTIALDKYAFVRDAYLQRRRFLIRDGNAGDDPLDDTDDHLSGDYMDEFEDENFDADY